MTLEEIDHVNLIVENIDVMTRFYRDILGLRVTKDTSISGEWISELTGLEDVAADVVYLESSRGPGVELIRYRQPQGERPGGLGAPHTKGLRHVAFRVDDLEETVQALRDAGVEFLSAPQEVPGTQVQYPGGKKLVYCRDPEGNLLELCAYGG